MYLKKSFNPKTGRTYLSAATNYHDPVKKQSRTRTIQSFGYVDVLEKTYPDPIAHFTSVVRKMNAEEKISKSQDQIKINRTATLSVGDVNRKFFGYAALSKVYHDLKLHTFFINRARNLKIEYVLNNVVKLLVFERLRNPASKKKTFDEKDRYFENMDFSLDNVYGTLSILSRYKDDLQIHLHNRIKALYGRTTELVYYDVTNYYFEIDEQDEMRKKGVSKEHRPDPIIQMGLFMDTLGIPILYRLFPGNTNDCETLRPILAELKRDYDIGRVIVVADKGNNTVKNINYHVMRGDGYVYSQLTLLARGLAQGAPIMLLDEPTTYLDYHNQHLVLKTVSNLVKNYALTALVCLHDPNLALEYGDHLVMLHDGVVHTDLRRDDPGLLAKLERALRIAYRADIRIRTVDGLAFVTGH
jgi:hypothetical protein